MKYFLKKGGWIPAFLTTLVFLSSGCQRRDTTAKSLFAVDQSETSVTLIIDLSGSFQHQMANEGHAYRFIQDLCDKYFLNSLGTNDRLIIGQISGEGDALLWEGTPLALRHDFPTPESFRDFLLARSNLNGSKVTESLVKTLDYLLDRSPTTTSTRRALFVLSDMDENASDPTMDEKRAVELIRDYSKSGGVVGMYFVHQTLVGRWRENLRQAGLANFFVESDIVSRPTLPSFE